MHFFLTIVAANLKIFVYIWKLTNNIILNNMEIFNTFNLSAIAPDNYVAFTFFIGYIAMLAASVFFFVERGSVDDKWRNVNLLVSGL